MNFILLKGHYCRLMEYNKNYSDTHESVQNMNKLRTIKRNKI